MTARDTRILLLHRAAETVERDVWYLPSCDLRFPGGGRRAVWSALQTLPAQGPPLVCDRRRCPLRSTARFGSQRSAGDHFGRGSWTRLGYINVPASRRNADYRACRKRRLRYPPQERRGGAEDKR
jgi:hypothetical protein